MLYDCLIVDDEQDLAETTSEYFNMFDIKSAFVTNMEDCLTFLNENQVSLLLLDINLGSSSGFELCKTIRKTMDIPILFISARSSNDDVLIALNIGGDDYIHKPYTLSILLAKVKAVLKRYTSHSQMNITSPSLFQVDYNLCRISMNHKELKLKTMEYKLLSYLIQHKNRVITKQELFQNVWGDSITGDGTLNVHIRHLREKIESNPNDPTYIKTVWGTGYVFEDSSI